VPNSGYAGTRISGRFTDPAQEFSPCHPNERRAPDNQQRHRAEKCFGDLSTHPGDGSETGDGLKVNREWEMHRTVYCREVTSRVSANGV